MSFRRLLAGLALLAVVIVAIVLVTRGDEEPEGQTARGLRGFPVRGSLADDAGAIDAAVAEWREEIAEDEAEEDDEDADERAREARRPDPDDDIAVLWIGRVDDEREDIAILESRGLAAELVRDRRGKSWFLRSERLREEDFSGDFPIGVGDSILVPDDETWRYVDASFSSGYSDTAPGCSATTAA